MYKRQPIDNDIKDTESINIKCPKDSKGSDKVKIYLNKVLYIIPIPKGTKPGENFNVELPVLLTDDDYLKAGLSIISGQYLNDSLSGGAKARDLFKPAVLTAAGTAVTAANAPAAVAATAPVASTVAGAVAPVVSTLASSVAPFASSTLAGAASTAAAVGTTVTGLIAANPVVATAVGATIGLHGIAKASAKGIEIYLSLIHI
mgnify:CR=1 FL=1